MTLDEARELLARMTLPELVELMHEVADEILLREMQTADDGK